MTNEAHRHIINKFYDAGYLTLPEVRCLMHQLNKIGTSLLNIVIQANVEGREIRLTSYDSTYGYMLIDDAIACLEVYGDFMVKYSYNTNTFTEVYTI